MVNYCKNGNNQDYKYTVQTDKHFKAWNWTVQCRCTFVNGISNTVLFYFVSMLTYNRKKFKPEATKSYIIILFAIIRPLISRDIESLDYNTNFQMLPGKNPTLTGLCPLPSMSNFNWTILIAPTVWVGSLWTCKVNIEITYGISVPTHQYLWSSHHLHRWWHMNIIRNNMYFPTTELPICQCPNRNLCLFMYICACAYMNAHVYTHIHVFMYVCT